ncbi:hypothetical protein CPB86DRAFT_798190 [Serendipita vermifera]|nr:hypothetical protein CPB86DRAFT_798190 [Serendipita vermifera]
MSVLVSRNISTLTQILHFQRRKINRMDAMILGGAFLLFVPLETFTFYGRYGILEDLGPGTEAYLDMKCLLLNYLPSSIMAITSIVFNALTLRNVLTRRRKRSGGDTTGTSNPPIYKHLLLTTSSSLGMLFGSIWSFYPYVKYYLLQMDDHINFPDVFVPTSEVMETIRRKFFYTRFFLDMVPVTVRSKVGFYLSLPIVGMYFFAFFGLGKEARKMHRGNFQRFASLLGWKRQNNEPLESSDPEQSHSRQRWRLPAIFNGQKGLVAPFDLPRNILSPSLEKLDLDTGHHTIGKARAPDQINVNRPPSLSMHKSPLPSPSQSSSTSHEAQLQSHGAVNSGKSVQTGLESPSLPQHKPPLPPSARPVGSNDNAEQDRPQVAPLVVPPPAYSPETLSRERQYWV